MVMNMTTKTGGVISKSWRPTGHWAATSDEADATIITATDLADASSIDPFAAAPPSTVPSSSSGSATTTVTSPTKGGVSSLDWRAAGVAAGGPAGGIAAGVAHDTVEGAARAMTAAAMFLVTNPDA
jgi:hypothetical protein